MSEPRKECSPSASPSSLAGEADGSRSRFLAELREWGPEALPRAAVSEAEASAYCRRLATSHYENFPVLSWWVPRALRLHMANIYAYCRWADDLGDEVGDAAESSRLLTWWQTELGRCFAGEATHPVFVALRHTVREFDIPQTPFADLLSAFQQDQRLQRYATFVELRDYCRRSADPVGRLVLYLFRAAGEQNWIWSDSICTGLQLANFWQDVARDQAIGRCYLPREDLDRFGYRLCDWEERRFTPEFAKLLEFEVERARSYLNPDAERYRHGLAALPWRLRMTIDLFRRGGLRILDRIEQQRFDVWSARPKISKWDLPLLAVRSLATVTWLRP